MRHGKKINHLGRTASHRKAMLANMACSLIEHKRINTTVAKAKELKRFIEPLITKSKSDTTHNRRIVFSYLKNKYAVSELFREVVEKVGDRPGGYTRIIKTGNRLGDNAEMCMIELVDFNEIYSNEKEKKTTRRSRRGKKSSSPASEKPAETKKSTEEPKAAEEVKPAEEEPKAEEAKETKKEESKDKE
jgi:large subunit ribosomal protein L17